MDARGRVHLQIWVGGKWTQCQSEARVGLLKWAHIAGTYDAKEGLAVYVNGKRAGSTPASGPVKFASDIDLLVGRNHKRRRIGRSGGGVPTSYSFDGYIDEVKIHDRALGPSEIAKAYEATKPEGGTGMAYRKLPTEPKGPAPFGAYYTNLKFHETWDAIRREGAHPDIVVLFDDMPWRFIFWRGSGFVPFWVTENNIWYTNEFNESWPQDVDVPNTHEPMSDKQARTSHVRIIENTDARVVVHWRYALVNILYQMAYEDPLTGWGDWADEYNYIYPDGLSIRKQKVWSSRLDQPHEFQESIVLSAPGTRPEDTLEPGAFTVMNMDGGTYTYSFAKGPPEPPSVPQTENPFGAQVAFVKELSYPNIQMVNTKSKAKPFLIVSDSAFEAPWPIHAKVGDPLHFPYTHGRINWEHCMFTWWNHWPVAQIPSDGRTAYDPDRVSHTAVSNWFWKEYESTQDTQVKIAMQGLTEKAAEELVPLAKSWLRAPALKLKGSGYTSVGYDQAERAYLITCENRNEPKALRFELAASEEHPVINPAFVIMGWGDADATLKIDERAVNRGKEFRFGHRRSPGGKDLIVWIKTESNKPVEVSLFPGSV